MNQQAYLQYRQVYGRASTEAELEVALRGLDRSTMLRLISAIGFSLNLLIADSSHEGQRAAIKRFFPKDQAAKILANGDVVFHRHQLLFLGVQEPRSTLERHNGFSRNETITLCAVRICHGE